MNLYKVDTRYSNGTALLILHDYVVANLAGDAEKKKQEQIDSSQNPDRHQITEVKLIAQEIPLHGSDSKLIL